MPTTSKKIAIQKLTQNNIVIVLLIIAALIIGYLFSQVQSLKKGYAGGQGEAAQDGTQQPQQPPERPTSLKIKKPDFKNDRWRGTGEERIVMVEYSDLQCPFCKTAHPTIQRIFEESKGKVAWVYRHFPLQFHEKAQPAAETVECANELGGNDGFWQMVDAIYEKMPDVEVSKFPDIATEIGLDKAKFQTCLDAGKQKTRVSEQLNEGSTAGIAATPTIVVYDIKTGENVLIEGALPYEQMNQTIQDFIKKQGA